MVTEKKPKIISLKKVLAVSSSNNIIFKSLWTLVILDEDREIEFNDVFCSRNMLLSMAYCKLNLLLVFIPKYCFFWQRLHSLFGLTNSHISNEWQRRIEFMHSFCIWWLIFLQTLLFYKNFIFQTFVDKRVNTDIKIF
jgi:hypothetical protein